MKQLTTILTILLYLHVASADDKPPKPTPREALKPFNDLIGGWKATGEPEGTPQEKQRGFWKETVNWGWKFKGDDAWIVLSIKDGKHFKSGELRYLPDKERYQLSMNAKDAKAGDKPLVFEGELTNKGRSLVVERTDDKTKQSQRITINLVGDIRFVYLFEHKPPTRKQFIRDYMVAATKEGESFGPAEKKPECVVTGGLGTSTVMHKGVTYYLCCTGCRDAFLENPEKFIKEFMDRKAKEKTK